MMWRNEFNQEFNTGRNKGEADISIIRFANIYMIRAEAKLRKIDTAAALANVNIVRASCAIQSPPALTSMTLDMLFRKRSSEFYWEMLRRTDVRNELCLVFNSIFAR